METLKVCPPPRRVVVSSGRQIDLTETLYVHLVAGFEGPKPVTVEGHLEATVGLLHTLWGNAEGGLEGHVEWLDPEAAAHRVPTPILLYNDQGDVTLDGVMLTGRAVAGFWD